MTDQQLTPRTARAQLAALLRDEAAMVAWRSRMAALGDPTGRTAAVLVLFGMLDAVPAGRRDPATAVSDDLDVLLLARAATLRSHPGQVAFPGGRMEASDADVTAAALREANEETGLDPDGVDVIGMLPAIPLPVSRHLVTPVLGWWRRPTDVAVVDEAESSAVFRVPVADLLSPAARRTSTLRQGSSTYRGPAFLVAGATGEHLVWGFTAGILDALFDGLGWTEPWDATRTIEVAA